MNTKLLNKDSEYSEIIDKFNDVFKFENEDDKLELDSKILSAKFLSLIQSVADKKGIKTRKELAELLGTSPSYLTQLFRGNKVLNLLMLAKIQRALDLKFDISLVSEHKKNINVKDSKESKLFNKAG